MRKSKKVIVALCLFVVAISAFIGGGTFSKYISKVNVAGSAQIAKWVFKVNGNTNATQTVSLVDTSDANTLVNGKVAPGTEGNFNISIDATEAEVGVKCKIAFSENSQKPQNLYFMYKGVPYYSVETLGDKISSEVLAMDTVETLNIPIKWVWEYETDKVTDTDGDGILDADANDTQDANSNYQIDITVTGTQVELK